MNKQHLLLDSGVVTPGDPDSSYLLELVASDDPDYQMPPDDAPRVPKPQQAKLAEWVAEDLPWESGFTFADRPDTTPLALRAVDPPGPESKHPVDRLIDAYLDARDLPKPEPADDATFLRRASLDLVGLLPDPGQVDRFVSSDATDKHLRLVDELLSRDVDYAEHWLTFWNDLLRNDYAGTGFITGGRTQISRWLYRALAANKPFDQFTRELIAPPSGASRGFMGGIRWRGAVSAAQSTEIQFSQNVSQAFLGINMKCASCHDSFIDDWQLEDAYGLAAIVANEPLKIYRCDKPTGEVAQAAWLYPELGRIDPALPRDERLDRLAELMTAPGNGRYARAVVNRLWAQLMGRGIVHPLDAMNTEPWNADLLDYLAGFLIEHDYDLKAVLRLIATSDAYRSRGEIQPEASADAPYVYAGPRVKRLTAEQFVDAVWQLTGAAPNEYDAPLLRGKLPADPGVRAEMQAEWIWGESADGGSPPPAGDVSVFRKVIRLDSPVVGGAAAVTADNEFELYINGRRVASGGDRTNVQAVRLADRLGEGDNELVIVCRNGGDAPNPAGLYFEARLQLAGGGSAVIASDATWEASPEPPDDAKGNRLGELNGPWSSAVTLGRPDSYVAPVGARIREILTLADTQGSRMVRASLVKADFLMRSLGRPNRDQIVTSRPNELTTLEAINLANGSALAKMLEAGGRRLASAPQLDTETLVRDVYIAALAREPTPPELALLTEALGDSPDPKSVQDFLWSVVMMPEFMFIR